MNAKKPRKRQLKLPFENEDAETPINHGEVCKVTLSGLDRSGDKRATITRTQVYSDGFVEIDQLDNVIMALAHSTTPSSDITLPAGVTRENLQGMTGERIIRGRFVPLMACIGDIILGMAKDEPPKIQKAIVSIIRKLCDAIEQSPDDPEAVMAQAFTSSGLTSFARRVDVTPPANATADSVNAFLDAINRKKQA